MNNATPILIIAGLLMSVSPAHSHHAFAAHFTAAEDITIEGVVTGFLFQNPHCAILIDVTDENGETQGWVAAGNSKNSMYRAGWTGEELQPGDHITISGNPSRDGSAVMHWREVARPDGTVVEGGGR